MGSLNPKLKELLKIKVIMNHKKRIFLAQI